MGSGLEPDSKGDAERPRRRVRHPAQRFAEVRAERPVRSFNGCRRERVERLQRR